MNWREKLICFVLLFAVHGVSSADSVPTLAEDFWQWRAVSQPSTGDDIPRISRPANWVPDWSPAAVAERYRRLQAFELRWQQLGDQQRSVSQETDYQLLASALSRVRWELDHVAAWQRQPAFYLEQTLTPIFTALLPPPPLQAARLANVVAMLEKIPTTLADAEANLQDMRQPFIRVALAQLENVPASISAMEKALRTQMSPALQKQSRQAVAAAVKAYAEYAGFLQAKRKGASTQTAVGRDSYTFFLHKVALYPYQPQQLLLMAEQEWARMVAFEQLERQANTGLPELELAGSLAEEIDRIAAGEQAIREFLSKKSLLSLPGQLQHYAGRAFPDYLLPIAWLGRTYDMTAPQRLQENATVYLYEPSAQLGYFNRSLAQDPRPVIVHEGIPGHYLQKVLSWQQENPLRRHYYDSGANEGIGFYAEEMLLQAGLFDDSPRSREIIYNFARLRALRVEVDVKLALGEYTIEEAADYLHTKVPMDRSTAEEEAVFFAATPGQAISYQIGKLQVVDLLAKARMKKGKEFSIRDFHDFLWRNGNVPIALLAREYLADE